MAACQNFGKKAQESHKLRAPESQHESSIEVHRRFIEEEKKSIQEYISDRNLDLERNGTGIYYQIGTDTSISKNIKVNSGDDVKYHYKISLLNGNQLYSSAADKPAILRIDKEDAEIGLHDALKLMSLGDKGLFILPSHRAFGVSGDQNKVPPFTALVYDLEIVDIQKLQNPNK
jgi:FKBP-type peptidyl-prolyl cis-trans isomerase